MSAAKMCARQDDLNPKNSKGTPRTGQKQKKHTKVQDGCFS